MPLGVPNSEPHLLWLSINHSRAADPEAYPFSIPAIRHTTRLELHPKVTYFVGENGSGKSTLLEGLAVVEGFNPEGGTRNFAFETRKTEYDLKWALKVARGPRGSLRHDGFFFRAESFYNVATEIERLWGPGGAPCYGPKSLHEVSHGESLLNLMTHRLQGGGLFLFDEPESALSPQRQLAFLRAMHELVENDGQLVIATHSPIIMAYPESIIYHFTSRGIEPIEYHETEHVRVTTSFLNRREQMVAELLRD